MWPGIVAGAGSAGEGVLVFMRVPGSALCDTGLCDAEFTEAVCNASGPVVIALSGFNRWSWLGPSPRLIRARESGTVFDCQP